MLFGVLFGFGAVHIFKTPSFGLFNENTSYEALYFVCGANINRFSCIRAYFLRYFIEKNNVDEQIIFFNKCIFGNFLNKSEHLPRIQNFDLLVARVLIARLG